MPLNQPYSGDTRKLALGIDVGTTYSGVSYCILDPGEAPQVFSVTRFPGQEGENRLRDTKIPSVLYYSEGGDVRAIGAEARTDAARLEAMDEGWILVEWFKLHLRPGAISMDDSRLPHLPANKSVIEVFADFLSYLWRSTLHFISETHPVGRQILQSHADIEYVLSHPNGWGGSQQSNLRRAAVLAGLIPDTDLGQSRIHFVTEGEASLHFCITNGLAGNAIKVCSVAISICGNGLMIVDAGGGTVDLSTYRILNESPINVVESVAPDCLLQGSTFVNIRARQLLLSKLKTSRFANDEDILTMLDCFETSTKPTFRDPTKTSYIRFGGPRDNDENNGIKRGVLSLSGSEMADQFRLSINAIQAAIQKQSSRADAPISTVLLVGGFAASPFLRSELQAFAQHEDFTLFCPEGQSAKAVAEGALSFYLDQIVSARVAKYAYGSRCRILYNPDNPSHAKRSNRIMLNAKGSQVLSGAFSTIVPKGTLVSTEEEFRIDLSTCSSAPRNTVSSDITAYRGPLRCPQWTDENPESFTALCAIRADLSGVPKTPQFGLLGRYFHQEFQVVLLFGLTELKAQLSWVQDGEEHRSSATIVYDDDASLNH